MDLEQRVKALEYEIKILKNEIQRTLLDIQEQILIHYYPALRSEETGPSDGTVQAMEAVRQKQNVPSGPDAGGAGAGSAASQVKPPAPPPVAPSGPRSEISLEPPVLPALLPFRTPMLAPAAQSVAGLTGPAIMAAAPGLDGFALGQAALVVSPPALVAAPAADPVKMLELLNWALASASRIGEKETNRLVDICQRRGLLSLEVAQLLKRVTIGDQANLAQGSEIGELVSELLGLLELLECRLTAEKALGWIGEAAVG
jgi:hypothetical protein